MLDYAALPMTAAIAALPRTRSGMPVPYTTQYQAHDEDPTAITRLDGRHVLACRCEFGVGRPQFGKPCPKRQRNCMDARRCVVCGRRISPTSTATFLGLAHRTADGVDDHTYASIEPPAHTACAAYAALACPHLVNAAPGITVGVTRGYAVWQQVVTRLDRHGDPVVHLSPRSTTPTGVVDLHVAIIDPANASIMTLDQWFDSHAPKQWLTIYSGQS